MLSFLCRKDIQESAFEELTYYLGLWSRAFRWGWGDIPSRGTARAVKRKAEECRRTIGMSWDRDHGASVIRNAANPALIPLQ